VTDEGTSALGPTPELIARRLRELRETTGQHDEQLGQHGEQLGQHGEQLGQHGEQLGQHGEQLASIGEQLREHVKQLQLAGTRHADLSAVVSEDLALKVEGLRQFVKDDVGQLRADVDVLLNERREQEQAKNAPVDWAALTEDQAAAQWPILARWVGEVLVARYELTRDELPDCWALHLPVVAELSWLRTAYVEAYLTRSPPQTAADWHTRWRPGVLTRIKELIKPDECPPGRHTPRSGPVLEVEAQDGAPKRAQLAAPECWWPFYDRAYHLDLAMRRARAAAGEFDWSPVRESA
jgi:hypothetical protein